jgi:3-methyladenine DNA glycosylase AlkD
MNLRNGAGEAQFGVKLGDIREIAKPIKTDHVLGLDLWATGNVDARLLAILILKAKDLTTADLDALVRSNAFIPVSDWLNAYVVKQHLEKETLRAGWMDSDHPIAARAGWSLTAERVAKDPVGLDLTGLLNRLERDMPGADPVVQWTMNTTLAFIDIHNPGLRVRTLTLGETMGIFRDYPVSKGCTSPFAPIWITEMVRRAG